MARGGRKVGWSNRWLLPVHMRIGKYTNIDFLVEEVHPSKERAVELAVSEVDAMMPGVRLALSLEYAGAEERR
jgi:hypothetical protein